MSFWDWTGGQVVWDVTLTGVDGFDVVAECTGVESIVQDAINYVARGGTLLVYGVYADNARVSWSPTKIFVDEIRIIGSFSQTYCFPRAIDLLDSGKIRTKGMVYVSYCPWCLFSELTFQYRCIQARRLPEGS